MILNIEDFFDFMFVLRFVCFIRYVLGKFLGCRYIYVVVIIMKNINNLCIKFII